MAQRLRFYCLGRSLFVDLCLLTMPTWAKVQLTGERIGITLRMTQFNLHEGMRTIELSIPGLGPVKRVVRVVDVQTVTTIHDFDAR